MITRTHRFLFYILFLFVMVAGVFWGCNPEPKITVSGRIDYVGSSDIYFAKQPLHYKYAQKRRFHVSPTSNGAFHLSIPVDSTQIIDLTIEDKTYPVVAQPGNSLDLTIVRAQFPGSVKVAGYPAPWDSLFTDYFTREQTLFNQINEQLPKFRQGDSTSVLELYQERYQLVHQYFSEIPLAVLYHQAIGEYLVKRLEALKYRRSQPDVHPEKIRQKILEEAKKLNFFSFESLHAQRAGIRDFTNAFANTFGVADSLEKQYGQELTQYDIKRLGYKKMDSARRSVLEHIPERRARAYAEMHLVAERIGEMSPKVAEPSYKRFLEQYSDFPKYTSFLKKLYEQIERVSPGNPAISFSIPNKNEEIVRMKDFRGKYVLLDFWASWCIPCLDEFPHMKELYKKYSRDDFEIVAISIEEDSLRWRQTIQRFNNPWPQLYGGNGFQQKTFRTYRGGGIPFYILVDPKGNIVRYNDIRPSFNLSSVLDSLLSNSKPLTN